MTIRRPAGDEGSVLVMTLFFLIVVGFIITGLLNFSLTSFSTSGSLLDQRKQVYAAEGALYSALQSIRGTANLGAQNVACPDITTPATINGLTTKVTCSPQPGSGTTATNRPQYALLALPASGSATEGVADSPTNGGGGGTSSVYIGGNVASNGLIERVSNSNSGAFYVDSTAVARGSCVGRNIQNIQGVDNCTTTTTDFADPGVADPTGYAVAGGFPASTNPAATCLTNAAKFVPGWYTAAPSAPAGCTSKPWWFSPGLYYFDFTGGGSHTWTIAGHTIVGGTPNTKNYDPTTGSGATLPGACKTETDLPPYTGVQWVFGADTGVTVSGSGLLELCATPSSTKQEIALYGYGAAGQTSTGATTTTQNPVTATSTGAAAFQNPGNATAIDGTLFATRTWPSNASNRTSTLITTGFVIPPSGASVEKVLLRIKHRESSTTTIASLAASVALTGQTLALTPTKGITMHEDSYDVTTAALANPTLLSAIQVTYTAIAQNNQAPTEDVDGIVVDVTYAPSGGFRKQAGCAIEPVTATNQCDTLATAAGATTYLQGTAYAPLGRVDIITAAGDPVQLNRGVIARDIVAEIHPGNGSSHAFGLGRPDRLVLLTASVQVGAAWVPRVESLVAINDNIAGSPGSSIRLVSWRDIR